MNQRSHTGWLTDMTECIAMLETSNARFTERIIELEADLAAAQEQIAGNAKLIAKLVDEAAAAQSLAEERRLRIEKLCGMLTAKDSDLAAAQAERDRAEADRDAIRELMNVYNLGGWTDALGPMKRALKAEAEVAALRGVVQVGINVTVEPMTARQATWVINARIAINDIPPDAAIEARKEGV